MWSQYRKRVYFLVIPGSVLILYCIGYVALRLGGIIQRWDYPVSGNPNFIWINYHDDYSKDHVKWMNRLFSVYKPLVGGEQFIRNYLLRAHRDNQTQDASP